MRKQICILASLFASAFSICHKIPNHIPSNDLEINLQGKPEMYVPGSFYKVVLESKTIFSQFFMTTKDGSELGSFIVQNDDRNSKFLDECENTVVEVSPGQRTIAHARWASPMSGCTTFIAIINTDKGWLSANKTLCALKMKEIVTKIDHKCCACDHAKYKIVFQGIWSPETHPKHFPSVLEFTHFSDLVGASHSVNYTMWREGMYATYGLKQLAEYGVVQEMELELKNASKHLRNLIKLSGLWYPNVNGNMTGIFRVDPRHNLLSLASMFGPSPDWIVGVSSLNLCQDDCSWVEEKVLNLYPYDAGTDNGISYMSPKTATDPQERIKRITPMYPDDERSPFYNMDQEEIDPPIAKLYIIREKIINKQCSDLSEKELMEQITLTENSEDEGRDECKVTEYTSWSECSVTCGKGLRTRTRQYIDEIKSKQMKCDRQLVSREMCIGQEPLCQGEDPDEDLIPIASGDCDVTLWSNWTDCSVTCGIGMRIRSRSFISNDERVRKKCLHISLMEKEKCMLPTCFMNKPIRPECRVSVWSEWSPCSATCGQAFMVRDRRYLNPNTPKSCNVELKERKPCPPGPDCPVDSKQTCKLDIVRGPCRNNFTRYAFNKEKGICEPFLYGGCRGNTNNFETLPECKNVCLGETKPIKNCVVSRWSSWSRCWPCPNGEKTKMRSIIRHPSNGGKACPELIKTIKCSLPPEFCQFNEEELDF